MTAKKKVRKEDENEINKLIISSFFNFNYLFTIDDKIFDPSWFKDILFKIKQKINELANPSELRESFEVNKKNILIISNSIRRYFQY